MTLKRKYFNPNVTSRVSDVFKENSFYDVTLVSDDQKPFQAHKFVLSAFSPVFKDILLNTPHSHPVIYLRGIQYQELDLILQFIYLGEITLSHKDITRFVKATKDLGMKKLTDYIDCNKPKSRRDSEDQDGLSDKNKEQNEEKKSDDASDENRVSSINVKIDASVHISKVMNVPDTVLIPRFSSTPPGPNTEITISNPKKQPVHDVSSITGKIDDNKKDSDWHEESKNACRIKKSLSNHTRTIHKRSNDSYQRGKYNVPLQRNLRKHQESVPEDVKYFCEHCDFQTKLQSSLIRHQNSVHEVVKPTSEKSTRRIQLTYQKKTLREETKYLCDKCKYQTGRMDQLTIHKHRKHSMPELFPWLIK